MRKSLLCLLAAVNIYALNIDPSRVEVERIGHVYDGDTFRADLKGYPDIIGKNIPIRIKGVDAPELRGKCKKETVLAVKAREFTKMLLRSSILEKGVVLRNIERGTFFRLVANVHIFFRGREVSLKTFLLAKGLAVNYIPGISHDWCK